MALLEAKNLTVGYGENVVVDEINLKLEPGQVYCLLGPNGSGKSTIIRTLARLQPALGGSIELDGRDLRTYTNAELAKKMSLVLTEQNQLPYMRVYELLAIARSPYTDFLGRLKQSDREAIDKAMVEVGIREFAERYIDELSDGERQKVFVARALVQDPEIIILDEPTSHLDIRHMVELMRILQNVARNREICCFMSLHELSLAIKSCQYLLLLHQGKVAARGLPEDILQEGLIDEFYELQGAKFNEQLGSLEISGAERNDVFIWAGGNYGIEIYRALAREGLGLTSGILSPYDMAYPVAEGICYKLVCKKAYQNPDEVSLKEAIALAKEAKLVIDSAYSGQGSVEFIKSVLQAGKELISLRSPAELEKIISRDLYKQALAEQKLSFCSKISELLRQIKRST